MSDEKRSPWPVCIRASLALAVIISMLALAGCQSTPKERIVPQIVERRIEVPASLLTCKPEPRLSAALAAKLHAMQDAGKDVAIFINELALAGQDCRSKLAAVRRLVEAQ